MSTDKNDRSTPPRAEKRPKTTEQLGRKRVDNYAWMKDRDWQKVMRDPSKLDADIRAHLERENAYTAKETHHLDSLKSEIFEEMKGRIKPDQSSVPSPDGVFAYYHQFQDGDQHGAYKRRRFNPDTREEFDEVETILDAESLAKDQGAFFDLETVAHSPDHKRLAYSVDRTGSETYEIFIKDMLGEATSTGIKTCAGEVQWAQDSRTLFWVERDDNQRPYAVFSKNIDEPNSEKRLVFKEDDPGFFVSVGESDSRRFIEISSHDHTTSEIWLVDAQRPESKPICVAKRKRDRQYSVHEHGDHFYILTNDDGATDFKIMRCPIDQTDPQYWEPYIEHQPGTLIIGVESFSKYMTRLVRENALPKIIIRDMDSDDEHIISFAEEAYALGLSGGYEYDTDWVRFAYSSPTTPRQIFDYNMRSRERVLKQTQVIPSGHEPSDYKCERLEITARDGESVPITLIYRTGLKKDGKAPLLLYGYGSYGITIPAGFRTGILSLVDRGFVYAIAHIRGGMSKGYQWYLDGRMDKKINTFNDYVDAGRALCELGYSQSRRVVAHGGSAGGLLVGAALNQAPDLFGGVIAAVPFVDVLNTMSDASLPLTPPEWPEWGNPLEDEEAYDRIADYSPYDNVVDAEYPAILVTGGLTDPRVTYWEPAKWAAKLRDHQKGNASILLKINMEAGHQGESGRYDSLKETAFEYAFAVSVVDAFN